MKKILICLLLLSFMVTACSKQIKSDSKTTLQIDNKINNKVTNSITLTKPSKTEGLKLKSVEKEYISNYENPETVLKYGNELYNSNFINDSVVYLSRALSLGKKSDKFEKVMQMSTKGFAKTRINKILKGWNPTLSHDGRFIAFISENKSKESYVLKIYNLKTQKTKKLLYLEDGEGYATWSNDNSKIALINDNRLYVINVKNNKKLSYKIPGLPFEDNIVWSKDNNKIAIVTNEDKKYNIYLLNTKTNEFNFLCEGSSIIGFDSSNEQLLIELKEKIYSVMIKNRQTKFNGNIPNNIMSSVWLQNGEFGIGTGTEKQDFDRSFGNDVMYFNTNLTKTIFSSPKSFVSELLMNNKGNFLSFTISPSLHREISFGVLWVADINGEKYKPIDYGYIRIKQGAFTDDGNMLVYSKEKNPENFLEPNEEVYLVYLY